MVLSISISISRQRVPMINASTLEDRTRPALDGSISSRLRYFSWPSWSDGRERIASDQALPTQARTGRR